MNTLFDHYMAGERIYAQIIMPVCEKYRLTYTEMTVIMFLANNPSYDTASNIVKCKSLAKSHVSVSVHSLEKRGFLECEYYGTDRRSVHLKLTDKVSAVIEEAKLAQKEFIEVMLKGITGQEREMITSIFHRIDRNISAYQSKEI